MCLFHRKVAEVQGKLYQRYIYFLVWSSSQLESTKQRQVTTFSIDEALFCGAHHVCKFSHSDIFKNHQQFWSQRFWWFFFASWNPMESSKSQGLMWAAKVIKIHGWLKFQRVLFCFVGGCSFCVFFPACFPFAVTKNEKTLYYVCPLLRLQCMSCQHIAPKILKNARIFTKVFLWYPNIFPIFWGDFLIHKVIVFLVAYQKTTRKRRITGSSFF